MSLELLSSFIFSTHQQELVVHVSVFGSRRGGLSGYPPFFRTVYQKIQYLGKQMGIRGRQKRCEANQPSPFLNRHALGQKCNNLKLITYSLMADWYHQRYFKFITKTFATAVA